MQCTFATLIHDESARRTLVYCGGHLEAVVPHDDTWADRLRSLLSASESAEEFVPAIEWAGWIPRTLEGLPSQVFAPVEPDHPLSVHGLPKGQRPS